MNNGPAHAAVEANRAAWDERAIVHLRDASGFYAVDRFRAGEDILFDVIASEIGNVRDKRLAHLQCHIGLETLCLARRGAIVTGLDYSDSAITGARSLAAGVGLAGTFVCGDVYHAPSLLKTEFDIVFVSWGSLNWLPDLGRWSEAVAALLAPGGYLYLIEQHPFISVMKEIGGRPRPYFAWRTPPDRPVVTDTSSSYNNDPSPLRNTRLHEWDHPLSDIIGALLGAGLRLDFFREHEELPWRRLPMMVLTADRMFRLPASEVPMPLSFSIKASKP
jgi:SAM-dependent methyltransferase